MVTLAVNQRGVPSFALIVSDDTAVGVLQTTAYLAHELRLAGSEHLRIFDGGGRPGFVVHDFAARRKNSPVVGMTKSSRRQESEYLNLALARGE